MLNSTPSRDAPLYSNLLLTSPPKLQKITNKNLQADLTRIKSSLYDEDDDDEDEKGLDSKPNSKKLIDSGIAFLNGNKSKDAKNNNNITNRFFFPNNNLHNGLLLTTCERMDS